MPERFAEARRFAFAGLRFDVGFPLDADAFFLFGGRAFAFLGAVRFPGAFGISMVSN